MEASIEKQRASVRRQVQDAVPVDHSFYTVAWPAAASDHPARVADAECEPMTQDQVQPLLESASERAGLTPDLLRAVIRKESSFRPCAVSPKGAMGLMQLMPATAAQFGVDDPFDPEQNVNAGARFLKQLLARYGGDLALTLGAYNAGPGRVDAARGVPALAETLNYVLDIRKDLGLTASGSSDRP